jgi:hypothetical protein
LVVRGLDENADEEMLRYEFSKHAPIKVQNAVKFIFVLLENPPFFGMFTLLSFLICRIFDWLETSLLMFQGDLPLFISIR